MSLNNTGPVRSWQKVAALTAEERDPQKVLDLARELIRLLDEEDENRLQRPKQDLAKETGAA